MTEQTQATPASEPTASPAAPAGAEAPKTEASQESKGAAAKEAAKNAAQAGKKAMQGVFQSIKGFFWGTLTLPWQILKVLTKGSLSSRLITLGFMASIALLVFTSVQIYLNFILPMRKNQAQTETGAGINEFLKHQKELTVAANNLVFLDKMSAGLTPNKSRVKIYEFEAFLECNAPGTAHWIRAHLAPVRESLSIAMQDQSYDKLITDEGKEELKAQLATAVNGVLKRAGVKGSIVKIYFTRFLMAR